MASLSRSTSPDPSRLIVQQHNRSMDQNSNAQATDTSSRSKAEILESIRQKLIIKYGSSANVVEAIDNCMLTMKKRHKISFKEFTQLEADIKKQIKDIGGYEDGGLKIEKPSIFGMKSKSIKYPMYQQDQSSPRGMLNRTDKRQIEKGRIEEVAMRSHKRSTRNNHLKAATLKNIETNDMEVEDTNKDIGILPKIQGDWNQKILQTFSPKNANLNRTALKRSFLTEDRKQQPYYMADEFTALKHQYYKNNDNIDRHLNTIGPIKEVQAQFNRSNDNAGYYQKSLPSSNQNSAVFQSEYDQTDKEKKNTNNLGKQLYKKSQFEHIRKKASSVLRTIPGKYEGTTLSDTLNQRLLKVDMPAMTPVLQKKQNSMIYTKEKSNYEPSENKRSISVMENKPKTIAAPQRQKNRSGNSTRNPTMITRSAALNNNMMVETEANDDFFSPTASSTLIVDVQNYQRELEMQKQERKRKQQELAVFYRAQDRERKSKERQDWLDNLESGKMFLNLVDKAKKEKAEYDRQDKKQKTLTMVEGCLDGIERKLKTHDEEKALEKKTYDLNEAYQQEQHLIKVREDLKRKSDLRKAQDQNRKILNMKHAKLDRSQVNYDDSALVEKVGITAKTKGQLKNIQQNLPIGGNLYFELNRLAYDNDQGRRMNTMDQRYNYILNKSPIKNHAIAYGAIRSKELEKFEDQVIKKSVTMNGIF